MLYIHKIFYVIYFIFHSFPIQYNTFHYKLYYWRWLEWKVESLKSRHEFKAFLGFGSSRFFCFNDRSVHSSCTRLCKTLRSILDQIHQSIIWTLTSIEEIKHKENLTFSTKQWTWSISLPCLHLNRDQERVQNLEY